MKLKLKLLLLKGYYEKKTNINRFRTSLEPILKDHNFEDGTFSSISPIIDNDPIINKLDKEVNDLWCSLISVDENSSSGIKCDYERAKQLTSKLFDLIKQIKDRLDEINDDSYYVYDMISRYLEKFVRQD